MRITRIEGEGAAGRVAIERPAASPFLRVDSIIRDPRPADLVWKTWHLSAFDSEEEFLEVARELQHRTDGAAGTNGDVDGSFRELRRFAE